MQSSLVPGDARSGSEAQRATKRVLERIATGEPLAGTLAEICKLVEAEVPDTICSILLLDDDGVHLRPGASPTLPALSTSCDGLAIGPSVGSCGTAAYMAERTYVADIANDPRWEGYRDLALPRGLRACWSTPILSFERADAPRRVLGTFALYARNVGLPRASHESAIEGAEYLARIAIESARSVRALRESENRFRTFIDHAADAVFVHDHEGHVIEANEAACRSLGYERHELLGKMPCDFDPQATPDLMNPLRAKLGQGQTVTFDSTHVRKDGSSFPVEIRIRELTPGGPRLAMVRDVTERKRAQEKLAQAQKLEAIGRLAGGIAHDFNNLLMIINGLADDLLRSSDTLDSQRADLESIQSAGRRAADLTAQLLAFGRRTVVEPRKVDLNASVEHLGQMLRRIIGEDIAVRTDLDPALPLVEMDPSHVDQLLMNLVINARDAMPDGGVLTIATRAVDAEPGAQAKQVRLRVSDTGRGMTEEVRSRVFEPFFTTKGPGSGTGLGLATAYGIVEQAAGRIAVESTGPGGTTFAVWLPGRARDPITSASGGTGRAPGGAETVLVVEDEEAVRKLVTRMLSRAGYTVLSAPHARAAIALAAEHPGAIDILVTDVVMPGMGGRELAETIRASRSGLRVLFMSGHTDDDMLRKGVSQSTDAFLQKPFLPDALARKVRELLDA